MTRSKQRSHCHHSCGMCDPGKRDPGTARPSDERKMQDDPYDMHIFAEMNPTIAGERHRTGAIAETVAKIAKWLREEEAEEYLACAVEEGDWDHE